MLNTLTLTGQFILFDVDKIQLQHYNTITKGLLGDVCRPVLSATLPKGRNFGSSAVVYSICDFLLSAAHKSRYTTVHGSSFVWQRVEPCFLLQHKEGEEMIIRTVLNHTQEASLGKSKLDRCIRHNHTVHIGSQHRLPISFRHHASVL